MKPYRGPLTTLGNAATAKVRVIVWCRECQHRVEPDPEEYAARYGADLAVVAWVKRLKCSQCGSRKHRFRGNRGATVASSTKPPWPPRRSDLGRAAVIRECHDTSTKSPGDACNHGSSRCRSWTTTASRAPATPPPSRPPTSPPPKERHPPPPGGGPPRWHWSRGRWRWNGHRWVWAPAPWRWRWW
jgi:hypothetical protein